MAASRRFVVSVLACLCSSLHVGGAIAQAYPNKPIRFVVPFAPGGNTDVLARLVAQKLTERLGQQVIVDNRGGAGGVIGTEMVARATPDGYTLLMVSGSHVINPSIQKKLPYDSLRDFRPISLVAEVPSLLVAHPSVPVKDVAGLVQLAKQKPGTLNYGSSGTGTAAHLGFELFTSMSDIKMQHVPYKGNGPATIALLGGELQFMFGAQPAAMPHVKSGKLRALGVSSTKRSPALPNVPAIAEVLPGYEFSQGFGMLTKAGTPEPIVQKLSTEVRAVLDQPEVSDFLAKQGATPAGNTPEAYMAYLKREVAKMAKIVKVSGAAEK
jgi:tripartite-type tricarboxylate transporter receptor subunit TctC